MTSEALRRVLVAGSLALALAGCKTVTAPTTPSQLALAEQSATLATQATDLAVNTGKLNVTTLTELNRLSDAVHAAVTDLEKAQAAGQPLSFDALNAAMAAYSAYVAANVPGAA